MANQPLKVFIDGLSGELIISYCEAATPTAYIGQTAPRAFPVDYTYDILNLRRVVHTFEFWQSNDGVTLNQLIKKWDIDVAKQELPTTETYYYKVDGGGAHDPASGQLQLRDERLLGKQYVVFEKGTGHLRPIADYTDRSDDGGGFDKAAGYEFQEGGEYMVTVFDKVVVDNTETTSTGGGGISDVVEINEDVYGLTNAHWNKLLVANYATNGSGEFRLQQLTAIPDLTRVRFSTQKGNQQYLKILFYGFDTVRFHGKDRQIIYLGKNESIELLFKGGVCYVVDDQTGYKNIGDRVYGDIVNPNTLIRNGGTYNYDNAGRLIEWVLDNVPPLQIRTFTDWNSGATFQKFFAWDAGTQTLKVPNSLNVTERSYDGTNIPGTYQNDQLAPFDIWTGQGGDGGSIGTGVMYNSGGFEFKKKTLFAGNTETRVKAELLIPLIRI